MESLRVVLLFANSEGREAGSGGGGGQMEAHFGKTKWKLIGV